MAQLFRDFLVPNKTLQGGHLHVFGTEPLQKDVVLFFRFCFLGNVDNIAPVALIAVGHSARWLWF